MAKRLILLIAILSCTYWVEAQRTPATAPAAPPPPPPTATTTPPPQTTVPNAAPPTTAPPAPNVSTPPANPNMTPPSNPIGPPTPITTKAAGEGTRSEERRVGNGCGYEIAAG